MHVWLMRCGAAALLLAATWPARADQVPMLNVDPVCHGIAEQAAEPSESGGVDLNFKECVSSEQEVRDQLAKAWSTFPAPDKTHCVREAQMGGLPSYTDLLTCLEMARDVRTMKEPMSTMFDIER